jgi:hypothetical protein
VGCDEHGKSAPRRRQKRPKAAETLAGFTPRYEIWDGGLKPAWASDLICPSMRQGASRVPSRSRLTEHIAADLASAGTAIASPPIGNRIALPQAMALGLASSKMHG